MKQKDRQTDIEKFTEASSLASCSELTEGGLFRIQRDSRICFWLQLYPLDTSSMEGTYP